MNASAIEKKGYSYVKTLNLWGLAAHVLNGVEVWILVMNKTEKQVFQTLKREHQIAELSF